MSSVQAVLKEAAHCYPPIPKQHLRVLLSHLMKVSLEFLIAYPETEVASGLSALFLTHAKKMSEGMPLSRLLKKREFWGMDFELSEATLDPRPDSETLVEAVLKHRLKREEPLKILDLGTGTGCLLISLLNEYPNAEGIAVDQSLEALKTAEENSHTHGVSNRWVSYHGNWFEGITSSFDVIISNPPYISENDYETLDDNVRNYDPKKALIAGPEGLDCYQVIIPTAPSFLNQGGILVLEIGYGQQEKVKQLMEEAGLQEISIYRDLGGIERCLVGVKYS